MTKPWGSPLREGVEEVDRAWGAAREVAVPRRALEHLGHDGAAYASHSLRAGGATDYLASGEVSESWVMRQGGWLSSIFRIYYRPLAADGRVMADRLTKAALATL